MSHIDDVVGALPLHTAANVLGVTEDSLQSMARSIVLVRLGDSNVPLGTGIVIHHLLVLTSRHNLEGLRAKSMQIVVLDYEQTKPVCTLSIDGVLESNYIYDFVILKLTSPLSNVIVAKLQTTALVPNSAILMHHSQGGPVKCTHGRILFYTTQNFPIVQALIYADVLSSGGGYFDGNGNLFGMHVSVGRLGLSPTKELLTINTMLRCAPKNSILEQVVLGKSIDTFQIMDDTVALKVSLIGEQSPSIAKDELSIPIIFTIWIPRLYPEKLKVDEAKYFYKMLVYGIIENHIFAREQGKTLVSLGKDGLFRDDQTAAHDQLINMGGIRLDFMGHSHNNRYRVFQACINVPPREKITETQRLTPRPDMTCTVLAQVEMISQAEYYYSSTINMTKQLTNRLRIALYRSYHSKRIARIT